MRTLQWPSLKLKLFNQAHAMKSLAVTHLGAKGGAIFGIVRAHTL